MSVSRNRFKSAELPDPFFRKLKLSLGPFVKLVKFLFSLVINFPNMLRFDGFVLSRIMTTDRNNTTSLLKSLYSIVDQLLQFFVEAA
jgi:hypothetical protein